MPWAILAVGAITAIASYAASTSANERAAAMQNKELQDWFNLHIPNPEEQKLVLSEFINQGKINPILETAVKQDPTAFNKLITDPKYKQAENNALSQLQQIGDQGGLRIQDRAAIQDALTKSRVLGRSNNDAVLSNFAQRGVGGSGFQLQAQLANNQAEQDQAGNDSMHIAAQANQRALDAIMQGGQLGQQLHAQDYNEQSQKASSEDAINRFNAQNLQNVNDTNNSTSNRDNELNWTNAQRISDANTGLKNQQALYNAQLPQQYYDNQVKQMAGASGQFNNLSNLAVDQGKNTSNAISNIGGAAASGIGAQQTNNYWDNYFKAQNANNQVSASTPVTNYGSAPAPAYRDPNQKDPWKLGGNYQY